MRTEEKPVIIPPIEGWKANSIYLVEASFEQHNPISVYPFYTGFLDSKGNPAGYNEILLTEDFSDIGDLVYLRALKLLGTVKETSKNTGKLPREVTLEN